ncbi:MAG: hypothetical protein AAF741_18575 [Bacteroidota bacterium]
MRLLKSCYCLIFLFLALGLVGQETDQSVRARISLSKTSIQLGDQTTMTLTISAPAGTTLGETNVSVLSQSGELELIRAIPRSESASDPTLIVHEEYRLTSFTPGVVLVPALNIPYTLPGGSSGEVASQSASLTVTAIPVEGNEEIGAIKGIYREPMRFSDFWPYVLIAGLVLGLAIALLNRLGILGRVKKIRPAEVLPPHQTALVKLSRLEFEKPWAEGKIEAYYNELSDILRKYLQGRFGIAATKQTTSEIESALGLRQEIDSQYRHRLVSLLKLSDMIKFADQKPTSDDHAAWIDELRGFVRATEPKPEPTEPSAV